jgi:hypothetical protein
MFSAVDASNAYQDFAVFSLHLAVSTQNTQQLKDACFRQSLNDL